jgi:glycosyltransferase involved in cell wall biosynthesis
MKKISWIQIASRGYGGRIYGQRVRQALSKDFEVELENIDAKYLKYRYLKPIEWAARLLAVKTRSDLCIRDDFNTIIFAKASAKNLALVYHIDFSVFSAVLQAVLNFLNIFFIAGLKRADAIVTISEYWKNYFLGLGYKKVYKIYCGFDLKNFEISGKDVENFKEKYNLKSKPIVYIGNCQKAKGTVEAYQALKDLDVYLVTSGEEHVKIPSINLNLTDYKDYLCLLKASVIAITMSKFKEGWCMTAHEAMLCKTPVIGSGMGGMKELLDGGKQIICTDFKNLKKEVEQLLQNENKRKKMGEDGYEYAKNFTSEKFEKDWISLIKCEI